MVDAAQEQMAFVRREIGKRQVSVRPGLVISATWVSGAPVTVIAVDDAQFTNLPIAGSISLVPGMTVNVLRLAGQLIVMGSGSSDVFPLQGTVSATGTGTCQVQLTYSTGTRTVSAAWLTHYVPAVGDVVMLEWAYGAPVVVGKLSQALPSSLEPPYIPPLPPPGPQFGTEVFTAVDSGTLTGSPKWDSGKDVTASQNGSGSIGYWFYGTKIKSTMVGRIANPNPGMEPAIFLDVDQARYGFDIFLHAAANRNGVSGFSTVNTPSMHITKDRGTGWFGFPASWATTLFTNGGGIGIQPSGDSAYLNGIDQNSQSGALRLPWLIA